MRREDHMEKWMASEDAKSDREAKIVRSSTAQITEDRTDSGLAAMDAIARWLATQPHVPVVELAAISRDAITLGLQEETRLPEPFVATAEEGSEHCDTWRITIAEALELPGGEDYGYQTTALTALGNKADGSRILLNVARWQIFGIIGTAAWARTALLSQVMVQATESWGRDQHLWLVGLDQTAEKLIHFLRRYHPEHHFHAVQDLAEITPEMLNGISATLYVANADETTYLQYKALQTPHVGMLTEGVVTNEAMFMTEASQGAAIIAPMNVNIFPNVAPDLIEAMDVAWAERLKLEEQAEAEALSVDYDELLSEGASTAPLREQEPDEIDAAFAEIMTTAGLSELEADNAKAERPSIPAETAAEEDLPEEDLPAAAEETATEPVASPEPTLHLLGATRVTGPEGELTGRNAWAVALLQLSDQPVPARQLSEALWPGDDAEGHTARTRRSRLLTKVRSVAPGVESAEAGWISDPIATDVDALEQAFKAAPLCGSTELITACERVQPALADAGPWADSHRQEITQRVRAALEELVDRALDGGGLAVMKAARAAAKRMGE
jgi:hypothetical protein